MDSSRSREKYITLDRFLQDDHAMVHIVPSCEGVTIPEHLMSQVTVTLKISRLFRGRLTMSETAGIVTELLFSNEYFTCKIPFESVWAATSASGQMRTWPQDTPDEILASLEAPKAPVAEDRTPISTEDFATDVAAAHSIGDKSSDSRDTQSEISTKKSRPALRRIK